MDDPAKQPTLKDRALAEQPTLLRLQAETTQHPGLAQSGDPRLGRYRVLGKLGEGGMGEVFEVFDEELGRPLAAKVLSKDAALNDIAVHRFLIEAQVTGQLEHPNIVPLHELGNLADGRPFFTMKQVEGSELSELIAGRRELLRRDPARAQAQLERLLDIFTRVCEAIAFAHSRGVIHRDIKPSNVMVGAFGEVQVMDWGLAQVSGYRDRLDGTSRPAPVGDEEVGKLSARPTLDGQILGTPQYMAPEQASPESGAEVDERSDVFALGAVLYEILTTEPTISGPSVWDLLQKAAACEIVPPRTRAPELGIPRELEAIAMRALARDREARYASAGELRSELERYRSDRLVEAASYSHWDRFRRFLRLNRVWLGGVAAVALAVAGALGSVSLQRARELDEEVNSALLALERQAQPAAAAAERRPLVLAALRAGVEPAGEGSAVLQRRAEALEAHLAAHARLERVLAQRPGDAAAAAARQMARQRLADLALAGSDLSLAAWATTGLAGGGQAEELRSLRSAWLARRATRLEAMLADIGRGLQRRDRDSALRLDDYLREALGYRDAQTAARVAAALRPLIERARASEAPPRWLPRERDMLRFASEVLGTIALPEARAALTAWLDVVRDDELAVIAGQSLCAGGDPAALSALHRLRGRFGDHSTVWRRVSRRLALLRGLDAGLIGAVRPLALAQTLLEVGQVEAATRLARQALDQAPGAAPARVALARCRLAAGAAGEALRELGKAASGEPLEMRLVRAEALRRLRRHDEAEATLDQAILAAPRDPRAYLARSRLPRDAAAVALDLDLAVGLAPDWGRAWAARGYGRIQRGDAAGALYDYTRAIELDPEDAESWVWRGEIRRRSFGLLDGAQLDYQRAAQLAPGDVEALRELARGNADLGNHEVALLYADLARGPGRQQAEREIDYGTGLDAVGRSREALEAFQRGLAIDPTVTVGWRNLLLVASLLGEREVVMRALPTVRRLLGDTPAAGQAISQALGMLDPKRAVDFQRLANARFKSGDTAGAMALVERGLAIEPAHVPLLLLKGEQLEREGKLDAAEQTYAQALRDVRTRLELGRLRRARGELRQAESDLAAVRPAADRWWRAWAETGRLYAVQSRWAEAIAAFDKALAREPPARAHVALRVEREVCRLRAARR